MKEIKKIATQKYCNKSDDVVVKKVNHTSTFKVRNFKQELIKAFLFEVQKATQKIEDFNKQFFLEEDESKEKQHQST